MTSIGSFAFYGCSGLTSIVVEDGNKVYDSRDNCNAIIETSTNTLIAGCQNTVIPNSVTSIGRSAFYGCSSLTSITIPNSVTSIGSSAFEVCYSLTSITIPNSVTAIGSLAFEVCSGLTSIVVEDGNKVYDSRDNCNAIIETSTNTLIAGCQNTVIPNSVTSIGDDAFRGCSNLTSITIPNSVTSIGSSAFRGCSSLTSITIPNSVTSIGYDAFFQCSNLTEITIPNSMTSIGKGAFYGCEKLTSVTNYSTTPQQIASNTFSNYGTLHVVKGAGEAYANADYWKNFTIVEDAVDPLNSDTDISEYDNILYLDNTEVRLGQQAVLSFKMKNTAAIQTIGVYLELPEGMTVVEDDGDLLIDLSTARTKASRHAISSNYIEGQYRIGILGVAGREFEGTDGEVFTVTVDIDEDMAEGDYPIILRNINLTDTSDVPYNTEYYRTTISVVDITPGDANGDGSVNMSDANMVTNYFLGKTNTTMKAKAADVNNDGSVNMTDANMIVNMYLNQ